MTPNHDPDPVNHPPHYTVGEIECIDALRSALDFSGFRDYCVGNVIKYAWRSKYKGGVQDLKKALVYLQWAIEHVENQ